jgi:hypothetical protein
LAFVIANDWGGGSKSGIPTGKYDASRVTETVKADLRKNIMLLEGINRKHFEQVYDAASAWRL